MVVRRRHLREQGFNNEGYIARLVSCNAASGQMRRCRIRHYSANYKSPLPPVVMPLHGLRLCLNQVRYLRPLIAAPAPLVSGFTVIPWRRREGRPAIVQREFCSALLDYIANGKTRHQHWWLARRNSFTIRPERWNCLTVSTSRAIIAKTPCALMPPQMITSKSPPSVTRPAASAKEASSPRVSRQ